MKGPACRSYRLRAGRQARTPTPFGVRSTLLSVRMKGPACRSYRLRAGRQARTPTPFGARSTLLSVRMKGLEPPRLSAPDPKSGAAANYATSALTPSRLQRLAGLPAGAMARWQRTARASRPTVIPAEHLIRFYLHGAPDNYREADPKGAQI